MAISSSVEKPSHRLAAMVVASTRPSMTMSSRANSSRPDGLNASVDLELTVGLSGLLYERFDAGELDVIFVKRRGGDTRGKLAWREQLVWIGRPGMRPDPQLPLPLVLYPPPSISRALALEALERSGRARRPIRRG